jgi:transposase
MLDEGVPAESIMVALKLSRTTYFEWKKAYRARGLDGLKVRPLPGAAPKLTDRQASQLRGWLVGRDPRQFQFDFALWTRKIVRELIRLSATSCGLRKVTAGWWARPGAGL